ncbi:Uncharacterised protein [Mycobacteroides abscessus subsp. abscessus]|uniref:hypothetical protein n=1 Tax=Mycobacteroides abscessus TaxID=36809 RepID=UPI00092ACEB9|nr:hypothetical protein [Mycobacteroides abscessus]SIH35354.1 Uncharacterised protein [Mycobacteroides abscessus subsp. abscessus]
MPIDKYPELAAVVAAMVAHGDIKVETFDVKIDPTTALPDTTLYARVPGAPLQRDDPSVQYTHCIHRYHVIGGQDITWLSPSEYGSTTRGPFGENPADDDEIAQIWAQVLQELSLSPDPHARPGQD